MSGCHVLSIASDDTYQTTLGTFESSAHLFLDCNSRQQTELHRKTEIKPYSVILQKCHENCDKIVNTT